KEEGAKAAEPYLREALQHGRTCVQAEQGNHLYRWVLARTLVRLGTLLVEQGRLEEADSLYKEAQGYGRAVREGEPSNKRYALVLAESLLLHGDLLQERGALEHAQPLLTEGCALAREFQLRDSKDVRFRFPKCQGVQEGK
ncbi:tetratricopeptide repeat protein, partial [Hyalangium sp.]|uniref:tetratricopeptide repeat protein n=1 Tax=Hyalangium sp. TaxID=2028555 RepID=UPI002D42F400